MLIVGVLYTLFFASSVLSIAALRYVNLLRIWQIAFLVLDALMLASNVAVLFLIDRLNQQNRYELENAMLRMQMIHQEERIRMEEKTYQEIRILRHDMKRYFVTYLQLMRDGQYELVERDMEQVLGKKLEKNYVMYTRNPILNAVITEKAKRCREKQIAFEVNAGEECEIEAMDIAIMLSNLVDNAIEAEQKEKPDAREIKLYIQITENMLHLIVQNYVSQSVLTHNPELSTTKGNSKMHGIGLVGVKSLVKQMGGEIEIGEEQDMFMVHVCINV